MSVDIVQEARRLLVQRTASGMITGLVGMSDGGRSSSVVGQLKRSTDSLLERLQRLKADLDALEVMPESAQKRQRLQELQEEFANLMAATGYTHYTKANANHLGETMERYKGATRSESPIQAARRFLAQKHGVPLHRATVQIGGITRRVGQSSGIMQIDVPAPCTLCLEPGYMMVQRAVGSGWAITCKKHLEATVERCQGSRR